jgi:hypothetical protein
MVMEYWRVEKSWMSGLEGLMHLRNNREDLTDDEWVNLNTAIQLWWDKASKEKKEKIIEVIEFIMSLDGLKIKNKFKLFGWLERNR